MPEPSGPSKTDPSKTLATFGPSKTEAVTVISSLSPPITRHSVTDLSSCPLGTYNLQPKGIFVFIWKWGVGGVTPLSGTTSPRHSCSTMGHVTSSFQRE